MVMVNEWADCCTPTACRVGAKPLMVYREELIG